MNHTITIMINPIKLCQVKTWPSKNGAMLTIFEQEGKLRRIRCEVPLKAARDIQYAQTFRGDSSVLEKFDSLNKYEGNKLEKIEIRIPALNEFIAWPHYLEGDNAPEIKEAFDTTTAVLLSKLYDIPMYIEDLVLDEHKLSEDEINYDIEFLLEMLDNPIIRTDLPLHIEKMTTDTLEKIVAALHNSYHFKDADPVIELINQRKQKEFPSPNYSNSGLKAGKMISLRYDGTDLIDNDLVLTLTEETGKHRGIKAHVTGAEALEITNIFLANLPISSPYLLAVVEMKNYDCKKLKQIEIESDKNKELFGVLTWVVNDKESKETMALGYLTAIAKHFECPIWIEERRLEKVKISEADIAKSLLYRLGQMDGSTNVRDLLTDNLGNMSMETLREFLNASIKLKDSDGVDLIRKEIKKRKTVPGDEK